MRNWVILSEVERIGIGKKLVAALNSIGVEGATVQWNMPSHLPHWQLIIESAWCASKSRNEVSIAREQAMARADILAPINGVILKSSPPK
jgi:hypothetical protein